MSINFKTFVVEEEIIEEKSSFIRSIRTKSIFDLPEGEVIINVKYSSLNYKDALSIVGNKGITRKYPHTPGIDAAGVVVESTSSKFKKDDKVLCTGYDLGMNTSGGYSQYIRIPANWIIKCPSNLSLRTTMIIGTAGFTAMNAVMEIMNHNVKPADGKILVSGATGGVGIIAVLFLSHLGYEVIASSGKTEYFSLLQKAGAKEIISRATLSETNSKPLAVQKWIAAIDTVGGNVLTNILKTTSNYGIVATCGNVISTELKTSIFPFILRGVRLIGLASAEMPLNKKQAIWDFINEKFYNLDFEFFTKEIKLEELSPEIDKIIKGNQVGRVLISLLE